MATIVGKRSNVGPDPVRTAVASALQGRTLASVRDSLSASRYAVSSVNPGGTPSLVGAQITGGTSGASKPLQPTGVTPGQYGDAMHIGQFSVNAQGLLTQAAAIPLQAGGAPIQVKTVTAPYTVAAADIPAASAYRGAIVIASSSASTLTIPADASVPLPIGSELTLVQQGSGAASFLGSLGVAFVGPTVTPGGQGSSGRIIKIATDTWSVSGLLAYASNVLYAQAVLADNPVAFWQLNETSGAVAADSSPNAYNGAYAGTYTLDAKSLLPNGQGAGLSLAGGGYVTLPNVAALVDLVPPLTVELWASPVSTSVGESLVDCGATGAPALALATITAGALTYGKNGVTNDATSSASIVANAANYIVVAVSSSGALTFYLNTNAIGTGTTSSTSSSGAGAIGAYAVSLSQFRFSGVLQNVAVYSTELSQAAITRHWNAAH